MSSRRAGKRAYPPSFPVGDASAWRRIRKYAVPRWMIEQATERREAGDWLGSCAAANVDVGFDLGHVANSYGAEVRYRLEADLEHFAPDLMRWHLPRTWHGLTTLLPNVDVILADYRDHILDGPYLYASAPQHAGAPQRVTLSFGSPVTRRVENWRTEPDLWDVRAVLTLRERADSGGLAERILRLHDEGDIDAACAAAGITLDHTPPAEYAYFTIPSLREMLTRLPVDLAGLARKIRRLAAAGFGPSFAIHTIIPPVLMAELNDSAAALTLRMAQWGKQEDSFRIASAGWGRLPDLDLLRFGDITPEELHPLVRAALFPHHTATAPQAPSTQTPTPEPPPVVRVRCGGDWHELRSEGGRLRALSHTEAEENRERALRALGGPTPPGCFAVQQAWTSGTGWLPRGLKEQRKDFFLMVRHGDTPGVIRALDAGMDPRVRDGEQRSLLDLLDCVDRNLLLDRLRAEGIGPAAETHGRKP